MKKIAFAGTDGRTLLSAFVLSTATSEIYTDTYEGVVVRGTPAMPAFSSQLNWPVSFVATASNAVEDYTEAIIAAVLPFPLVPVMWTDLAASWGLPSWLISSYMRLRSKCSAVRAMGNVSKLTKP